MATLLVSNNEIITLADDADYTIQLVTRDLDAPSTKTFIEVLTSTSGIYFSQGEAIDTTKHCPRAAGSKFPMTYKDGSSNIHVKGAAGETLVITW